MDKVCLDNEALFIPYFVVYSTKNKPGIIYCQLFMSLHRLYDFINEHLNDWKCYRVGKTLETYGI